MRRVSVREANQNFSRLAAEVESGESLIVERRGVPFMKMTPIRRRVRDKEADRDWAEMMAILKRGIPMGGKPPTKDEIYDF